MRNPANELLQDAVPIQPGASSPHTRPSMNR
jgi:hypothetical protein